jgi:hypothetical protein
MVPIPAGIDAFALPSRSFHGSSASSHGASIAFQSWYSVAVHPALAAARTPLPNSYDDIVRARAYVVRAADVLDLSIGLWRDTHGVKSGGDTRPTVMSGKCGNLAVCGGVRTSASGAAVWAGTMKEENDSVWRMLEALCTSRASEMVRGGMDHI